MRCTQCDQPLDEAAAVWLELNCNLGTYHASGTVPPEQSQGCFPFGAACARAILRRGGECRRRRACR
jgi:hypothetical protein